MSISKAGASFLILLFCFCAFHIFDKGMKNLAYQNINMQNIIRSEQLEPGPCEVLQASVCRDYVWDQPREDLYVKVGD